MRALILAIATFNCSAMRLKIVTARIVTKFFTTQEKRDNAFKELVTKQMEWFENCKNSKYSNPDNYEIGEETNDDFLELYMDKWCYEWGKEEYDIED